MKKVLIIGIDSFTGFHLSAYLKTLSYEVFGTSYKQEKSNIYKCDITNKQNIVNILKSIQPNFIINLAAISYVGHGNDEEFYKINTIGTLNILDSIISLDIKLNKIILASSATVYGNQETHVLDESLCPNPTNHYGASKFAMECLAKNYFKTLPIIITRPFNYTGVGQSDNFLIPKIVKHFKQKSKTIELGNLQVKREFNDISFICKAYEKLLKINKNSEIVNLATNNAISLLSIIQYMNSLSDYEINVQINPKFVRKNEIHLLTGSSQKLYSLIGKIETISIKKTLRNMLEA